MNVAAALEPVSPVSSDERYHSIDAIRGIALFGVLLINLLTFFRVSLFQHLFTFHTHAGWQNRAVDILAAWLLEFKAFTLFSFLFGVGIGIQAERINSRNTNVERFLLRRFAVLLAFGLCHLFVIANVDILTLYAVCGLLLIPFVKSSTKLLVAMGIAAIALSFAPIFDGISPPTEAMRAQGVLATHIYSTAGFTEILVFRWRETWQFIFPLLISSLPKTYGLMLLGIAAWDYGILQNPGRHRNLLLIILIAGGILGTVTTTLSVWSRETGFPLPAARVLEAFTYIPLAFALGAGLLLWLSNSRAGLLVQLFAAAGRMALSNYLAQSIIFSLLFYGFGLALFGRLGSASAALIGFAVFMVQLLVSYIWLRRYRFGPLEWAWRSLTYGRRQPMKRNPRSAE